jgi:hypothetical protein
MNLGKGSTLCDKARDVRLGFPTENKQRPQGISSQEEIAWNGAEALPMICAWQILLK